MKSLLSLTTAALLSGPLPATVLSVGTIEQPINLGPKSSPSRIPLGPVGVESNHGYDIHAVISEPRPSTHGAIAWEKGLELNMNLASAFGIEIVPDDGTQVPQAPVSIHIKDWPVPAYSPYGKDQVLAATLHCLLRSVHAPPKTPLKVVINAVNPEDGKNLNGYAGTYVTAEADDQGGLTPVPGTRLETDWRGVTYVVFTDREPDGERDATRPPPVLIPFQIPDDTDDLSFDLLPVWTGDTWPEDPLKVLLQPVTLFYDRYDPTASAGPDINALSRLGLLAQAQWNREVDGTDLTLRLKSPATSLPPTLPATLSAVCHAAIFSAAPTDEVPLTVSLRVPEDLLPGLKPFTDSADWKTRKDAKSPDSILSCQFVLDQKRHVLTRGSVPLGTLSAPRDRPWSVHFPPESAEPVQPPAEPLPEANPPPGIPPSP